MHPLQEEARSLAQLSKTTEARLFEVLMQIGEERLFSAWGYSGLWDFLTQGLKFSDSQAGYFVRVAQRARVIPAFREAVSKGELSLSQARRIAGVIEKDTAQEWILLAKTLSQKALERKVSELSPRRKVKEGFTPLAEELSKLTLVVTVEEEAKFEKAQDILSQKKKKSATYQETLMAGIELFLHKHDPIEKAKRSSSRLMIDHIFS
jgi:hypothetical protein